MQVGVEMNMVGRRMGQMEMMVQVYVGRRRGRWRCQKRCRWAGEEGKWGVQGFGTRCLFVSVWDGV